MAEIGLIASVIQVAGAGLKLSQTLYQYADSVASADRRIKDIAKEVELTSFVIEELGSVFKQDDTSILLSKSALRTADDTVRECSSVFTELEAALKKSKKNTLGRLMLPFRESKIELLRSHIDKLKSTLQLLMQVLMHAHQVAAQKLDREAEAAQREQIKALIQNKKDSAKKYEESLRNYSLSEDSTVFDDDDDPSKGNQEPKVDASTLVKATSIGSSITVKTLETCVHHIQSLLYDIDTLQKALAKQEEGMDHSEHHQSLVGSYFRARSHLDGVLLGNSLETKAEDDKFSRLESSRLKQQQAVAREQTAEDLRVQIEKMSGAKLEFGRLITTPKDTESSPTEASLSEQEEVRVEKESAKEMARKDIEAADWKLAEAMERETLFQGAAVEKARPEARQDASIKVKEARREALIKAKEAKAEARSKEMQSKAVEEAVRHEKAEVEAETKAKEDFERKVREELAKRAEMETESQLPIRFTDTISRKFSFPFQSCKTWQGMEELIEQAFRHVDGLSQRVLEGQYDLINEDGDTVLKPYWEAAVRPGRSVTMRMWPIAESPETTPLLPTITSPQKLQNRFERRRKSASAMTWTSGRTSAKRDKRDSNSESHKTRDKRASRSGEYGDYQVDSSPRDEIPLLPDQLQGSGRIEGYATGGHFILSELPATHYQFDQSIQPTSGWVFEGVSLDGDDIVVQEKATEAGSEYATASINDDKQDSTSSSEIDGLDNPAQSSNSIAHPFPRKDITSARRFGQDNGDIYASSPPTPVAETEDIIRLERTLQERRRERGLPMRPRTFLEDDEESIESRLRLIRALRNESFNSKDSSPEEEATQGLMFKKNVVKAKTASSFRKAAIAAGAFQPRAGGAAARLFAKEKKSDEPDGIRNIFVPQRPIPEELVEPTPSDSENAHGSLLQPLPGPSRSDGNSGLYAKKTSELRQLPNRLNALRKEQRAQLVDETLLEQDIEANKEKDTGFSRPEQFLIEQQQARSEKWPFKKATTDQEVDELLREWTTVLG